MGCDDQDLKAHVATHSVGRLMALRQRRWLTKGEAVIILGNKTSRKLIKIQIVV
jgi:hypothetical protein